jgi:hypothetical protein
MSSLANGPLTDRQPATTLSSSLASSVVVLLGAALLLDAAVETWWSRSPVRWWAIGAVLVYLNVTIFRSRRSSHGGQSFDWSMSALSSLYVFLGLLALTTWLPGGIDRGVRALSQPSSVLLSAITACGVVLAGVCLVRSSRAAQMWPMVRTLIQIAIVAVTTYGGTAILLGLRTRTAYPVLLHGASFWVRLPFYLQGAFLGALFIMPLAMLSCVATALVRAPHAKAAHQATAFALTIVMAFSGFINSTGPSTLKSSEITTVRVVERDALPPLSLALDRLDVLEAARQHSSAVESTVTALGENAAALFAFVRDQVRDEVYEGVLRDPEATMSARAGNAYDKALLLSALLRHVGREVRFVRGRLNRDRAADVVEQMLSRFVAAPFGIETQPTDKPLHSVVSAGDLTQRLTNRWRSHFETIRRIFERDGVRMGETPPVSRDELIQEAADHVWLEYRDGEKWVAVDPTFRSAQPGETFADATETLNELPMAVFQRVIIREKLEQRLSATMTTRDVLRYQTTAAALNATTVIVSHQIVITDSGWVARPVLQVGDTLFGGQPFDNQGQGPPRGLGQGLVRGFESAFGAAQSEPKQTAAQLSSIWLEFEFVSPSGRHEVAKRDIVDRLGPAVRLERQEIAAPLTVLPHIWGIPLALASILACSFSSGPVEAASALAKIAPYLPSLRSAATVVSATGAPGRVMPTDLKHVLTAGLAVPTLLSASALALQGLSQRSWESISTELGEGVRFYVASPRLTIASIDADSFDVGKTLTLSLSLDLRRDGARVVGGDVTGSELVWANLARGVLDGVVEQFILEDLAGSSGIGNAAVSTVAVVDKMTASHEGLVVLESDHAVRSVRAPGPVQARMTTSVKEGMTLVAPPHPVSLGSKPRLGWWQVDVRSGETIAVMDTGLHGVQDAPETGIILESEAEVSPLARNSMEFANTQWDVLGHVGQYGKGVLPGTPEYDAFAEMLDREAAKDFARTWAPRLAAEQAAANQSAAAAAAAASEAAWLPIAVFMFGVLAGLAGALAVVLAVLSGK